MHIFKISNLLVFVIRTEFNQINVLDLFSLFAAYRSIIVPFRMEGDNT